MENIDIRAYRSVNKTVWDNYPKVCRDFRFDKMKFKNFIEKELDTTSEMDYTSRLVLNGRHEECVFQEMITKFQNS